MTDTKNGAPLMAQETPRRYNPRTVYHKRSNVSRPDDKKPWNSRGVVLAFCIGIVVGLIIGIIAATTIDSSIREFNENPRGAVQAMRMEEAK